MIKTAMHDLGIKITKDIMEPVIVNFHKDIAEVRAQLDRIEKLLKEKSDEG
jgi:hypothetical protein